MEGPMPRRSGTQSETHSSGYSSRSQQDYHSQKSGGVGDPGDDPGDDPSGSSSGRGNTGSTDGSGNDDDNDSDEDYHRNRGCGMR